MTELQAKKLFEKYNPVCDVRRCPNGRAKMRKPLDIYAKAAVNLYGIIVLGEFVAIFNAQNVEQTTTDEVYTILLPNILKTQDYGFYKDYIVHFAVLNDFDWVDYLKREQADKPRYIPEKEEFSRFEYEYFDDNNYWMDVRRFMLDAFGYEKATTEGYTEIKTYITHSNEINKLGAIMDKHNIVFSGEQQVQTFFGLIMNAKNNTRIWENKGHSPNEMAKIVRKSQPKEPVFHQSKKVGRNDPCPCGSGKKYKLCCALIENSGTAQLSRSECKLFYETWYKLLDFVNKKLNVVNYKIKINYPDYHDEILLHKIREKMWQTPKLISEFIDNDDKLSEEEINLMKSWEKNHINGQFVLIKYEPEYAVLMSIDKGKASKLYAVKGMTNSIAESMHRKLPIILETVLLPFGDKIIYDSFMASHAIDFGGGAQEMFAGEYLASQKKYGIITKI